MNVAVVDLGTNTFNCSVVSLSNGSFSILLEFHEYPQLGKNGVAFGYISDDAMERGLLALQDIKTRIEPYNCEKVVLIGTSSLRNARNASDFCNQAKKRFNFDITIISGEQEAEYIFLGNNLAFNWNDKTALILDIGGGSNECILCKHNTIIWKHSFECGMQRIVSKYPLSHPLPINVQNDIYLYLQEKFELLTQLTSTTKIDLLIGSAGAFDVFRSIYFAQIGQENPHTVAEEIPIHEFHTITDYLVTHSLSEIESMKGMSIPRAPLLPIAGLIAKYVIDTCKIPTLVQSSFSLKEGVIHTLL